MDFRPYEHPYSSDISKCYLRVLVDDLIAKVRLMIWFRDPLHMKEMVVFKHVTMDFGDSCSNLVIVEKKVEKLTKVDDMFKQEICESVVSTCEWKKDLKPFQDLKENLDMEMVSVRIDEEDQVAYNFAYDDMVKV